MKEYVTIEEKSRLNANSVSEPRSTTDVDEGKPRSGMLWDVNGWAYR